MKHITLVLAGLLICVRVVAHGGEDHSKPSATPTTSIGGSVLKVVSYPGNLEVLVKYPAPKLNESVTARIFFADYASNHPVNPDVIELSFPELAGASIAKQPIKLSDGVYEFAVLFSRDTSYTAVLKVKVDSTELLTTLSPFYAGSSADRQLLGTSTETVKSAESISLTTWLLVALFVSLALVAFWLIRKRKRHVNVAMLAVVTTISVVGILAHGGEDHSAPNTSGTVAADATSVGHVVISKESQFALGMLTERIAEKTLSQTRRVTGKIVASPNARAEVFAPQPGRIVSKRAWKIGDRVTQGQMLFAVEQTLTGSERLDLERALIEADRELDDATRDYNRKVSLEGVVAKKEIESAKVRMESANQRQTALKRGLSQGTRPIPVTAPITGTIANSDLTNGEYVEVSRQLLEIVNTSTVWIEAQLFEGDLALLPKGAVAIITSPSSSETYSATLIAVSDVIDPTSRTAAVIFALKNPKGTLRINSSAELQIGLGEDITAIAVPKDAVVESGSNSFVIVHRSPEEFEPVRITKGTGSGRTHVQVVAGVKTGDKVVITGLTHFRTALPQ
ncbi:MAG: efflux RND transporter periplasmic adaptor subunit [bacterium]|nr:efflux RND transporter periplasmic adaptor subunit [bacterium]